LMLSEKVEKRLFLSFLHKQESSLFRYLKFPWIPVFTGMTTSCEFINV